MENTSLADFRNFVQAAHEGKPQVVNCSPELARPRWSSSSRASSYRERQGLSL